MKILIIGGTRNVGHFLALALLENGHKVTILNRGKTIDELPAEVQRWHTDRSDSASLSNLLAGKSFDAVVDMALYHEADAKNILELLDGRVGKYIFLSTGQVYLVREKTERPFREEAYERPLLPAPLSGTRDYEEWLYGVEKSQVEDTLYNAWQNRRFPFTTLRLPMVSSERDHFHRIYNYLLRLKDEGPILLPAGKHLRLRHIYAADVVRAILNLIQSGVGNGRSYNISQDETVSIEEFLNFLAEISGTKLQLKYVQKEILESQQLFPDCSPFSDPWMSELDNGRSKLELGMQYTPLPVYLEKLVSYYKKSRLPAPEGYQQRSKEINLIGNT